MSWTEPYQAVSENLEERKYFRPPLPRPKAHGSHALSDSGCPCESDSVRAWLGSGRYGRPLRALRRQDAEGCRDQNGRYPKAGSCQFGCQTGKSVGELNTQVLLNAGATR